MAIDEALENELFDNGIMKFCRKIYRGLHINTLLANLKLTGPDLSPIIHKADIQIQGE